MGALETLKLTGNENNLPIIKVGLSSSSILNLNIDSFIDLNQAICNSLRIEYNDVYFSELIKRIKRLILPLLNKNVTFKIKKDILLPTKFVYDTEKLYRIIVRLLLNSIKHTPFGEVTLEICLRTNNDIQFIISDAGIGMNLDTITTIQKSTLNLLSNQSNIENISLAGLGLPTIQILLQKLGSKLMIDSQLGKGTTCM